MGILSWFLDISKIIGSLFDGIGSIFDSFKNGKKNSKGGTTIELPVINISLVAQSGFGKTTLISTVMQQIKKYIIPTDRENSYFMEVRPKDENDKNRLDSFDRQITEQLAKASINNPLQAPVIGGTQNPRLYSFEIVLSRGNDQIIQPFSMMDIPGGWIKESNRTNEKLWTEFLTHLEASRILWLPIDATVLMEAAKPEQKDVSTKIIDVYDVNELVEVWSKYRNINGREKEKSCVCYIPLKSETYTSYKKDDKNKGEIALKTEIERSFKAVKNTVNDLSPNSDQYYIPVETIGSIYLSSMSWSYENNSCSAVFKINDSARKIKGADSLIKKVYEYAYEQINDKLEIAQEKIRELEIEGRKNKAEIQKLKETINVIKVNLKPLLDEFGKASKTKIDLI